MTLELEEELRHVLNKHSVENESNTPDFILAAFLIHCLEAWTAATKQRDGWFNFKPPWIKGVQPDE